MLMEFKVPVIVHAKPKRTKDEKIVVTVVSRQVEIPEVSAMNAPVVVSGVFPGDENDDGEEIHREFREIDGLLYVDITGGGPFVTTPRLRKYERAIAPFEGIDKIFTDTFGSMREREIKSRVYPAGTAAQLAKGHTMAFVDFGDLDLAEVEAPMIDRCMAVFNREVAKLILVDGKMHLRERPPVIEVGLQVSSYGNTTHLKPSRRVGDGPSVIYDDGDNSGGPVTPLAFFQIDQREEALEFARSLGYRVKRDEIDRIEVEPDCAVTCNVASMTVNAIAVDMNNSIAWNYAGIGEGRELLNRLTVGVMHAYQRLESILPRIDDENVPAELAEVVEDVLALARDEKELFVPQDTIEPAMHAAIQLWHDRPVDLDITPKTWVQPRR